jgi:hypothetical protein
MTAVGHSLVLTQIVEFRTICRNNVSTRRVHRLRLNGVLKYHSVQHRHALLPVSIILDGGASSWSEDKVLRVLQGVLGPFVSRCSVRVKVVDEIDEGYFDEISLVKIDQVSPMRLKSQESVDRVDEGTGNGCHVQNRERAPVSWCCSLERRK